MLANQTALVHGQMVITKLLEEIIREVEIPLEVKEIEGMRSFSMRSSRTTRRHGRRCAD